MISTFQRNRHFRKVSVNKTLTHVQEQKKRCRRDIPLTFRLVQNRLKANLWPRWRRLPEIYKCDPIELEFVGKKECYNPFQIYQYFKCSSYSGISLSQTRKSYKLEGAWERLYVLYRWNDLLLESLQVQFSKICYSQQKNYLTNIYQK